MHLQRQDITESQGDLIRILLCSTQLAANHNLWKDNDVIQDIVDMNKNYLCTFIKYSHPYLDELSIKCIVLAFYIILYSKISTLNV